jgi:predicted ATPase
VADAPPRPVSSEGPPARDRRRYGPGPYILGARLSPPEIPDRFPFLPAIRDLPSWRPGPSVSFVVGENGSGKSTLIEALASGAGFSAEGGPLSRELLDHNEGRGRLQGELPNALVLETGPYRPRVGFYLRAESFFAVASRIDARDRFHFYGGRSMGTQSHGETFLALAEHWFAANGLYIFDEPEAALSVTSQLAFLALMHASARAGSQFIVATHSPILLGYPGADVWEASPDGLRSIEASDADPVRLTRGFMEEPERYLRHLFE